LASKISVALIPTGTALPPTSAKRQCELSKVKAVDADAVGGEASMAETESCAEETAQLDTRKIMTIMSGVDRTTIF